MDRNLTMISALISLLTGCAGKPAPAPAPPPDKPGVSVALSYPVLLIGERDLMVKDDESSLITTSVASGGVYYGDYVFVDSAGIEYMAKKATEFGRKAAWRDMGTSRFQVFLEMKSKGGIGLENAKALALAAATRPEVAVTGPDGKEIAAGKIGGAKSFGELIVACRDPWRAER